MSYLDFKAEMRELAALVEPADQTISSEAQRIGAIAFLRIDQKYGEGSELHLSHHATPHSIDMTSRNIKLINLLYPHIGEEHRLGIYDAGAVGSACHDVEQGLEDPGANERASGRFGVNHAKNSSDPVISSDHFAERITRIVDATYAQADEDDVVVQPNVCVGEPDPLVFTTAFADRNAIAMDGVVRMIVDVTNLAFEWFKRPTVPQYKNLLSLQADFIRGGMHDDVIKPQLAYHFPGSDEEVYRLLREKYNPIIKSAYEAAKILPGSIGLDEALSSIVSAKNPVEAAKVALEKFEKIIH